MTGSGKDDLIRLLEAELDFIEGGGYGAPAGHPGQENPVFYHGPSCINHWIVPGHQDECHDDCVLLGAVPAEHRNEALPCHHIPVNAAGDTIARLRERGSQEQVEAAVKAWLRSTIGRLKAGEDVLGSPEVKY